MLDWVEEPQTAGILGGAGVRLGVVVVRGERANGGATFTPRVTRSQVRLVECSYSNPFHVAHPTYYTPVSSLVGRAKHICKQPLVAYLYLGKVAQILIFESLFLKIP